VSRIVSRLIYTVLEDLEFNTMSTQPIFQVGADAEPANVTLRTATRSSDDNRPIPDTKQRPDISEDDSKFDSGDEESHFSGDNPFADPVFASHWKKVYDEANYECRHVFDPALTWTQEEEKKIIRKLDWHVCLWAVSIRPHSLQPLSSSMNVTRAFLREANLAASVSCSLGCKLIEATFLRQYRTIC
jgi:hypothetical protein